MSENEERKNLKLEDLSQEELVRFIMNMSQRLFRTSRFMHYFFHPGGDVPLL